MPRLHYYAYGGLAITTLYAVLYQRIYLPYTTHQREMERVLEAEKFVSQQLLQRAERLYRQAGVVNNDKLPSLLASTYALFNEFELADCTSALPKSLFVTRLKKIRDRCGLLPISFIDDEYHNNGNFLHKLKIASAYGLYWLCYQSSYSGIFARYFESIILDWILSLVNIPRDCIQIDHLIEQTRQDRKNKIETVLNEKTTQQLKDEAKKTPKRREDEITLDDDDNSNNKTQQRNVIVNLAHVSHWIEEVLIRHALKKQSQQDNNNTKLVIKYLETPSSSSSTTAAGAAATVSDPKLFTFTASFMCHGYPWYDLTFVEKQEENELSISSQFDNNNPPLVLFRPITVTKGLNRILQLEPDEETKKLMAEKRRKEKEIEEIKKRKRRHVENADEINNSPLAAANNSNKKKQINIEHELAMAEFNNSTLLHTAETMPQHQHQQAEEIDNNSAPLGKPSYEELIKRRRTLVNPTRVREEAEAAEREKRLTELLYSGGNKDESAEQQQQQQTQQDQTESSTSTSSSDLRQETPAGQQSWTEKVPNVAPRFGVIGVNDDEFTHHDNQDDVVRVHVNIGKPCVPLEVWPCILRQYAPDLDS
jgi:hypothetical protein